MLAYAGLAAMGVATVAYGHNMKKEKVVVKHST